MDTWEQPPEAKRASPATAAAIVAVLVVLGAALATWDGTGPTSGDDPDSLTIESGDAAPEEGADEEGADEDDAEGEDEAPSPTAAGEWQAMAASPLRPRMDAAAFWTGEHVLVWGGYVEEKWQDTGDDGFSSMGTRYVPAVDGGLYDPGIDAWQAIPEAPLAIERVGRHAAVWTGEELVVLSDEGVAAYSPDHGQWREAAEPPEAEWDWDSAVWTGEMVVLIGSLGADPEAAGYRAAAAAAGYRPGSDRWARLEAPPFRDSRTAGLGGSVVLFGHWTGGHGTVNAITAYDAATDRWSEPDPIPVEAAAANGLRTMTADPVRDRVVLAGATRDPDSALGDGWRPLLATWRLGPEGGWRGLPRPGPIDEVVHDPVAVRQGTVLWLPPPAGVALLFSYEGWRHLPNPTALQRRDASVVWTGEEVVVWGGSSSRGFERDGARWRLRPSSQPAASSRGSERDDARWRLRPSSQAAALPTRGEWPFNAFPD